jgi:hypothetical protein
LKHLLLLQQQALLLQLLLMLRCMALQLHLEDCQAAAACLTGCCQLQLAPPRERLLLLLLCLADWHLCCCSCVPWVLSTAWLRFLLLLLLLPRLLAGMPVQLQLRAAPSTYHPLVSGLYRRGLPCLLQLQCLIRVAAAAAPALAAHQLAHVLLLLLLLLALLLASWQ